MLAFTFLPSFSARTPLPSARVSSTSSAQSPTASPVQPHFCGRRSRHGAGRGGGGVRGTRGQRQTPSSSPAPTAPADRPLAARGKRGGTRSTRRTRDPSGWGEGRRAARACATKMGAAKAARRTRGPFGQGEGCGRLLSTCSTKVGAVGRSGLQVKPLLAVTSSWKASCAW